MVFGKGSGAEERDEVGTSGATQRGILVTSSHCGTEKQNENECHGVPYLQHDRLPTSCRTAHPDPIHPPCQSAHTSVNDLDLIRSQEIRKVVLLLEVDYMCVKLWFSLLMVDGWCGAA